MFSADEVHRFWFGEVDDWLECTIRNTERWFQRGQELDAPVREQFSALVEAAGHGQVDHWMDTPRGAISLILALDQLPRHIHRGSARAFDLDGKALQMCQQGIESGINEELSPVERGFFYLPLEHAENIQVQEQGVALMHANTASGPAELREYLANAAIYGELHRDIVARFGRFPHRNEVLGRASSEREIAYLSDSGQRFGQ
jgi:uncharacterized protein (DUF924 family)